MEKKTYDYIIIGAGILGQTFAYKLKQKFPQCKIAILEKEAAIGKHASGRNSGVLHSGIYYKEGTFKAKLCAKGARLWKAFCKEHGLTCNEIGKVIVPTELEHDASVDVLCERGRTNGVKVEVVSKEQLKEIEPEARTASNRALYLPETAVVDPMQVMQKLNEILKSQQVDFYYDCNIESIDEQTKTINTNQKTFSYGYLINTAGVNADKIATMAGVNHNFVMLPFRGVYFKVKGELPSRINGLIYPVPNLQMPFLGVHTTKSVDGSIYLGPTAMPTLGRENYHGFNGANLTDIKSNLKNIAKMYAKNSQGMRKHIHYESKTLLYKRHLVNRVRKLVPNLKMRDVVKCQKRGIRAQLFNTQESKLIMDFVVESGESSLHVLNAISPAFTSSMAFVDYLIEEYLECAQSTESLAVHD